MFEEAFETLEMGPPKSGVECGSAHIGGAKSIRLGDRRSAATIGVRRSELGRAGIGCDRRPRYPHMLFDVLDTGIGRRTLAVQDCTMIDWDDVRYFLAIARGGSVRAAAERLGVNHSTVLRRIAQLENGSGCTCLKSCRRATA